MTMATSRNVQPVALVANAKIARFSPHDSFACNKREIRKNKNEKGRPATPAQYQSRRPEINV